MCGNNNINNICKYAKILKYIVCYNLVLFYNVNVCILADIKDLFYLSDSFIMPDFMKKGHKCHFDHNINTIVMSFMHHFMDISILNKLHKSV